MDAKNLQDLLVDYLYGELDPEQRAEFEAALRDAPEVQQELEALEQTRATFAQLDDLEVPSRISDQLLAEAVRVTPPRVERAAPDEPGFFARLRAALQVLVMHPAMSAAVVMVAVLGVSFYVYRHGPPPTGHHAELPPLAPASGADNRAARAVAKSEQLRGGKARQRAAQPAAGDLSRLAKKQSRGLLAAKGASAGAKAADSTAADRESAKLAFGESNQAPGRAAPARRRRGRRVARRLSGARTAGYDDAKDKLAGGPPAKSLRAGPTKADGYAAQAAQKRRRPANEKQNRFALQGKRAKRKAASTPKPAAKPRAGVASKSTAWKRPPAQAKKKPLANKRADSSQQWLRLGNQAAASKRCSVAFDYYTRALRANPSLLGRISARIGPCRAALRRARGTHGWLARRIHGQERRPARRKAKARRSLDRQQESK